MFQLAFGVAVFFVAIIAFAQTGTVPAEPMAGEGWDIFGTIYTLLGGLLVAGLSFGGKKLIDLINAKVDNEVLRGILGRLVSSVNDAVAMVNQTMKAEIQAAKDPKSPGGDRITEAEKRQMFDAVWDALKAEYGGAEGIFKLLQKIGIGSPKAAKAKVDTMIEAAVRRQKIETKDPTQPTP